MKRVLLATTAVLTTAVALAITSLGVASAADIALSGQVSSAEEGVMEGVLVSAKKDGSNIRITVVTDAQGRYSFPAAKLEPGHYQISIRAVG
jgi:virginiamycin B lyase